MINLLGSNGPISPHRFNIFNIFNISPVLNTFRDKKAWHFDIAIFKNDVKHARAHLQNPKKEGKRVGCLLVGKHCAGGWRPTFCYCVQQRESVEKTDWFGAYAWFECSTCGKHRLWSAWCGYVKNVFLSRTDGQPIKAIAKSGSAFLEEIGARHWAVSACAKIGSGARHF